MRETITLNKREQQRLLVLNQVNAGQMTAKEAAELLGLSVRQVRRLLAAYRSEGAEALAHGNRGRKPVHALDEQVSARVIGLAKSAYAGCNHQHMSELLGQREQIKISRSSLRRILLGAGLVSPRTRRASKHRQRRERYAQEGMLLQVDGSRHDWLEGRGPWLTLVGAIDDATGTVPAALFREQEDGHGYFTLLQEVVRSKGRPVAIYHDGHSIFEPTAGPGTMAEQLGGKREPTQFGRLLEELGIGSVRARSPQAKGRVERLWGTFQDRLVTELRLAGAATIEDANRVLGQFVLRFNERFGVVAAQEGSAYRPVESGFELRRVFCFKYVRTVGGDNTVRLGEHRLQLLGGRNRVSYAHAWVEVQERLDGSMVVVYQGEVVATRAAPLEAPALRARKGLRGTLKAETEKAVRGAPAGPGEAVEAKGGKEARPKPSADHPWRRSVTGRGNAHADRVEG
jgi:transposase